MRVKHINLYQYHELSESAQERARDWYRRVALDDEWWDLVFNDAKECARILGIRIDNIYFSGFSSQGDGAQFTGDYEYQTGALKAIKDHAPQDKQLHTIAKRLQDLQRAHFYSLSASVASSGRYSHEYCTEIDVYDSRERDVSQESEETLKDLLRDFMRWIYRQLEQEYQWQNAGEQVIESIEANEYEFTEKGEIA